MEIDGENLNIAAIISIPVESATFTYDDTINFTENFIPYAVFGDNSGDYNVWNPTVGLHNLSANAFDENNGLGNLIATNQIDFLVIADVDGDGVYSNNDPDDNDECVPNPENGDCCELMVMNNQEFGYGSLLQVIECASSGDTIYFHPDVFGTIINLDVQFALINKNLFIIANIDDNITVNGQSLNQTFEIENGVNVHIEGLNIVSGNSQFGRAINNIGNLILKDCNIYDSNAGANGNVIHNKGSLNIKGRINISE